MGEQGHSTGKPRLQRASAAAPQPRTCVGPAGYQLDNLRSQKKLSGGHPAGQGRAPLHTLPCLRDPVQARYSRLPCAGVP